MSIGRLIEGIIFLLFGLLFIFTYKSQGVRHATQSERMLKRFGLRSQEFHYSQSQIKIRQFMVLVGGILFVLFGLLIILGLIRI